MLKISRLIVIVFLAAAAVAGVAWMAAVEGSEPAAAEASETKKLEFTDVAAQTREFVDYYGSIKLTPEQEKIKERALAPLPAACCSDNSMKDCCCPCNFAKSVWGLSNYTIAKLNYNEQQVREAAQKWIHFINPSGFDGQACYQGRCATPFAQSGCGGMNSSRLVF